MRGPLREDRVRLARTTTFGWIDHELRPWLRTMSTEEQAVYLFLVLAADVRGVSWYRHESIGRTLSLDPAAVRRAAAGLVQLDLVAYRSWRPGAADGVFQVLSLPIGGRTAERRVGGARPLAAFLPRPLLRDEGR